jgi:hypothetical protein
LSLPPGPEREGLLAEVSTLEEQLRDAPKADPPPYKAITAQAIQLSFRAACQLDAVRADQDRIAMGGNLVTVTGLKLGYREWLLEEAAREGARGCPTIRSVKLPVAEYFAALTRDWSVARRTALMRACVKRRKTMANVPDLPLEPDEAEAYARYRWPEDAPRQSSSPGLVVADRRGLRRMLRQRLEGVCHSKCNDIGGSLSFLSDVDGVRVGTRVDTGSRLFALRYSHRFSLWPHLDLTTMTPLDLLGEQEVSWRDVRGEDTAEVADAVATMCERFLRHAMPEVVRKAKLIGL